MADRPCLNPACHSHGQPHPNCRCYGGYAEGGKVAPSPCGCQYYADGGVTANDFIPDAEFTPDTTSAQPADNSFQLSRVPGVSAVMDEGKYPQAGDQGYTSGEAKLDPLGQAVLDTGANVVTGGLASAVGRAAAEPADVILGNEAGQLGNAPKNYYGENPNLQKLAQKYAKEQNLPTPPTEGEYLKADPERGARIAQAYDAMPHAPTDPAVKKSYDALINETAAQYRAIKASGLKIEPIAPGAENPYPNGSKDMLDDLKSGHLYYYPTDQGFGQTAVPDHPMLIDTGEKIGDKPLLANDMFRIVHDVFGHGREGVGFGANGEENAWALHKQMYSADAQPALTTETRGQNSWVNYGPKGAANRANPSATQYAEQKAGILPEWAHDQDLPKNFSVISAENPGGQKLSPELNAERTQALYAELKRQGIPFQPSTGAYGPMPEAGVTIPHGNGVGERTVNELARKFGQESAIHRLGDTNKLTYVSGPNLGKSAMGSGITVDPNLKENYTKVGGTKFNLNLDFDKLHDTSGTANTAAGSAAAAANKEAARAGQSGGTVNAIKKPTHTKYADGGVVGGASSPDFIPDSQFTPDPKEQPGVVNQAQGQTADNFIPDDQFKSDEDTYGTPGQQAATFAEGVGQGVLGPIAPALERMAGVSPEGMRLRQETNPWTHGAGEVGGLVGSSMAGVGLGGALSKVGEAANALTGGAEVASATGRIAHAAFQAAAENAVFQGQDEVSKLIKQDPNQSAQTAMANIGLASVLGAGAGAAFGTVPELWKAAEGSKVAQGIADFSNQIKNRLAGVDPQSALSEELLAHRTSVANAETAARQTIAENTESVASRPAKYQKAAETLSEAADEFAPARDKFDTHFAMDDGSGAIDPDKVEAHLAGGKKSAAALGDYLDASKKYQKAIENAHTSLDLDAPEFTSPTNNMQASIGKLAPGAKLANYVFDQGMGKLTGGGIGAAVGHATGVPYGGTIGGYIGEKALGPALNSVIHSLAEPFVKQAVNSTAAKAATDYAISVAKGESMLNKAVGHVFKAGQEELPSHLLPAGVAEKDKLNQRLESLQTNPEGLMKTGGQVGHYLPEHSAALSATATNAANYLNGLRPNTSPKAPLDSRHLPPNPVKQAAYNKALGIAQKPLSVLGHLKTGRLTSSDVQTFQAIYPALYSRLSQKLVSQMTEHVAKGKSIPYQTRIALSRFLAQPLDSSLTPQAVFAAQPLPPMAQPQTATQPASNPKRSTTKLDGISKMAETSSQARTARANKA